jgi:hypothetical protein
MTITKLTEQLLAVEVENDSKEYFISENVLCWKQGRISCMKIALENGNYTRY